MIIASSSSDHLSMRPSSAELLHFANFGHVLDWANFQHQSLGRKWSGKIEYAFRSISRLATGQLITVLTQRVCFGTFIDNKVKLKYLIANFLLTRYPQMRTDHDNTPAKVEHVTF